MGSGVSIPVDPVESVSSVPVELGSVVEPELDEPGSPVEPELVVVVVVVELLVELLDAVSSPLDPKGSTSASRKHPGSTKIQRASVTARFIGSSLGRSSSPRCFSW
jgi:hypothetical protein